MKSKKTKTIGRPITRSVEAGERFLSAMEKRGTNANALALMVGLSRQAVYKWVLGGVPPARVPEVAAILRVTERSLRV